MSPGFWSAQDYGPGTNIPGNIRPLDRTPQDNVQIKRSGPGDDGPGTLCLSVFVVHLPSIYRTSVA